MAPVARLMMMRQYSSVHFFISYTFHLRLFSRKGDQLSVFRSFIDICAVVGQGIRPKHATLFII